MDDEQLLRYSRQIMLPEMEFEGQQTLTNSRVLIIGLGGLGSPVAMYLCAAGVGHLYLCDDDNVDLSNLQRQIIHSNSSIGEAKVDSAKRQLQQLNPHTNITTITHRLKDQDLQEQVELVDVVVDCSDNFVSRFALNQACVTSRTPLISGAAIRLEGQVSVFDFRLEDCPCYHCLYSDNDENDTAQTCSESGILAPVVGIIGSIQATETLKLLANIGEVLSGKLLLLDAKTMEWRTLNFKKDPQCPVCAT